MTQQQRDEDPPSPQKLTAWQRECAAAYEELVKAGIYLPAKNGIWQFSDEYTRRLSTTDEKDASNDAP